MIAILVLSSPQDLAPTRTPYTIFRIMGFGDSSTSLEFLFSACGDGGSTKIKKYNTNRYILANSFFKPTDKIVSTVTYRTYSCTNYEKSYVTCN